MTSLGQIKRNVFYGIAEQELRANGIGDSYPKFGFKKGYFAIGFKVVNSLSGDIVERHYDFPNKVGSFRAPENFRSQLRRFIREDIMGRGLVPISEHHRVRQPGGTIAHICHDVPKKILVPPKAMMPIEELLPPMAMLAPKKLTLKERMANLDQDDDVKITLLVKAKDVMTVVSVVKGSATILSANLYNPPLTDSKS